MTFEEQVREALHAIADAEGAYEVPFGLAPRVAAAIEAVALQHVRTLESEGYGAGWVQPEAHETALRVLRGGA